MRRFLEAEYIFAVNNRIFLAHIFFVLELIRASLETDGEREMAKAAKKAKKAPAKKAAKKAAKKKR